LNDTRESNQAEDAGGELKAHPLTKAKPIKFAGRSGAVTAAGVAFLLLALFVAGKFISATVYYQHQVYWYNAALIFSFAIFTFAGLATVLRWPGWKIWAGAASWMIIAAFPSMLGFPMLGALHPSTRFDPFRLNLGVAAILPPLIMLAISIFVLWARRQEPTAEPNVPVPSGDATAAGIVLILFGICFGAAAVITTPRILVGNVSPAPVQIGNLFLILIIVVIFALAGTATILRWRGWRIWAGTVSWLAIGLVVLAIIPRLTGVDLTFLDFGAAYQAASTALIFVFVLWAKRQEKMTASA
jgi:hypothetical protein